MEQLDLQLLNLDKVCDKTADYKQFIKKATARDFKIDQAALENDQATAVEAAEEKKRKRVEKNKAKKRKKGGEDGEDEEEEEEGPGSRREGVRSKEFVPNDR